MPKPNVTRVQSATESTASVHTSHMPKPNVTRVQSATEWTASVHTLHCFGTYFTLLSKSSFFLWLSAPQCQPQQRRYQQDRSPAIWWAQATHRRAYRHDWCCVAPAERCNPFKLGCAKPQNFCLHSCQAISDGERSWRKSHGSLCAQLETAAQVRQTKHTGVQKTGKKPRPASWLPEIGEHKEPLKHTRHVHGYRHHDVRKHPLKPLRNQQYKYSRSHS